MAPGVLSSACLATGKPYRQIAHPADLRLQNSGSSEVNSAYKEISQHGPREFIVTYRKELS